MATMGWVDEAAVARRVNRIATAYGGALREEDSETLAECAMDAYYSIIAVLAKRGYTKSQLDGWAQRTHYQMDVAAYNYLLTIGFRRGDKEEWIKDLKRLDELKSEENSGGAAVILDEDGDIIVPGGEASSKFAMLNLEEINDDLEIELP